MNNHTMCHCQGPLDVCCSPVHGKPVSPRDMTLAELQAELHWQAVQQGVSTAYLMRVALQDYLYPNSNVFATSPKVADPDSPTE